MTVAARRPSVRRWAGASAAALACALTLGACSTDDPAPASGESRDRATEEQKPSTPQDPTSEPAASESPADDTADDGTAVPVYFAGDGPQGTVLFREFHRVTGDALLEAARLVAGGSPDDPDYRTLWPQVDISAVTATDGVLLVEVPGDAFTERPDGMTARDAELAVQQLVRTLQGVQQERVPVQVERGGAPLFGLATDAPYEASSDLETLNLVSITSPAEGDTVTGDSLTVTGVANSFEASGPCRLLVGGEEVAMAAYQSEGWMEDRLFAFEVELPLEGVTGEAVVRCETDDPSGGAEGNGPSTDTKDITVR
jgi:PHD/YefM family antitoxin component YafN of YafNO toxin-antitoxin module